MFTMRFSEWTWQNIIVRIVFSLLLGIVIGIDRGAKRRGGGARTALPPPSPVHAASRGAWHVPPNEVTYYR